MSNRRFFTLLLILFFLMPSIAEAKFVCVCYFGANNQCAPEAIPQDVNELACPIRCQSAYGARYKSYEYGDAEATILSACTASNNKLEATPKTNPIVPKLEVEIPGLEFSPVTELAGEVHVNFLGDYIAGLYKYLIGISAIIAIVFVMIGGFQWALSAGVPSQLSSAKTRMKNAVTGLVLLLMVILILEIVNPELTRFDPLMLRFVQAVPLEAKDDAGDIAPEGSLQDVQEDTGGKFFNGERLCQTKDACVKWCDENLDSNSWPTANKKTIEPSRTVIIPESAGIKNTSRIRATPEFIDALKRAGEIAVSKNPKYAIHVRSGFRDLKTQIKLVCDLARSGNIEEVNKIGEIVAYPGGSNHGSGAAIDIRLYEDAKLLVTSSSKQQASPLFKDGARILAEIMGEAGFVRYAKEIWHFELEGKTTSICRCKGSQCPFPPTCR